MYFCSIKRMLYHSSLIKFLGNPLCKVTVWYSALRRQFIWERVKLSFLNHLAPSLRNHVAYVVILSDTKREKSPIWAFLPLKALANRRAISSLYPVNLSKKGNHLFLKNNSLVEWNSRVCSITCRDNGSCWSTPMVTDTVIDIELKKVQASNPPSLCNSMVLQNIPRLILKRLFL